MERGRAARRADVDAFLASLGIDPGELAGLELHATIDVMRERVEFLHSLKRVEFLHSLGLSARRDDGGDIYPRRPHAAPAPVSAPLGLVGSSGVVLHCRCPPHEGLGG
ncbi:Os09g0440600 [Oryza sativa Japonica Group]|uniref:Os09g0440600 protein n=2 Tax=Oryza sativa subsp. japonica TaxID=39947 RepID=A0A0P0XM92_ORYSJ|nr:hypothetical protein EE612_048112 [Oryza sativa]BAD36153.1 hypothetical protein [Oryza sativa Japonica Group]BAH94586.1 Os09g0440600 [Oryza sativa Japonica Group]BAT08289.1 Os09g0440600 [Oryza sativa Japonica Group]|eukprot:NP_001175858.1 Os09g0440600 [Oryza sativa Japonica Group]